MPKGHKRKNTGVGVDFKKVKRKVGKKLPQAQNATDTTVVSRSIALPEQSIAVDKSGAVTTHRNLTLKDLLGQCGHYSEKVRLDAINGLSELIQKNPLEARRHAATVVSAAAERAADADTACRAAQRDLFQKAFLPALGKEALQPFIPIIMGNICAAMTHLAEPIRSDALKLLEIIMEWRADLVATHYLTQILQHFASALARPARGRSLKAGSLNALLSIVTGLHAFLTKALPCLPSASASTKSSLVSIKGDSDNTTAAVDSAAVLAWQRCTWPDSTAGSVRIDTSEGIAARNILDLLIECWTECSPAELSYGTDLSAAKAATTVLQCSNLLLGTWGSELAGSIGSKTSAAAALLCKVAVYVPFTKPAVAVAPMVRDQLIQLNVAAAQLLVNFLPSVIHQAAQHAQHEPAWVPRVLDWLQDVMGTGTALPSAENDLVGGESGSAGNAQQKDYEDQGQNASKSKKGSKKSGGSRDSNQNVIPASVYGAALVAVKDVLPLLPPPRRRDMLHSVWQLWTRSPVKSSARVKALEFFSSILASPATNLYAPLPPYGEPLVLQEEAATWIGAMPRYIWELGCSAPASSALALRLLLDAARYALNNNATESPINSVLAGLQPQLAPLFGVLLPAAGGVGNKKSAAKNKDSNGGGSADNQPNQQQFKAGPLVSLPESTQCLAVDVLYHLPGLPESTLNTIALVALGGGAYPLNTCLRLLDVASSKASDADSNLYWGALLSLIAGTSRSKVERSSIGTEESWKRHVAVVDAACSAAISAAGPEDSLAALGPALINTWRQSLQVKSSDATEPAYESSIVSARVLHGLFSLCASVAKCASVMNTTTAAGNLFSDGDMATALAEASLSYIQSCIECAAITEIYAAKPQDAALAAVRVLSAEPAALLLLTLTMTTAAAKNSTNSASQTAIESCVLLLLGISSEARLESELVKATDAAEEAVKMVIEAVSTRYPQLTNNLQRMMTVFSQKLGKAF